MRYLKNGNHLAALLVRASLVIVTGLLLGRGVMELAELRRPLVTKLRGNAPHCPWTRILSMHRDVSRLQELRQTVQASLSSRDYDRELGIELIESPHRAFWIKRQGSVQNGKELLAYLLADHQWVAETYRNKHVRPGDVVLDCGAHIGVFTDLALRLGASKLVAIEPNPLNLECLRRNFAHDITLGRVILVAQGVWNHEGTLTLLEGAENSGMNAVVERHGDRGIEIEVTTIDNLVQQLQLPRIDYIKMDIEGAERKALEGARDTLQRFRPRLMVDSYHRLDDMEVLPAVIRRATPRYQMTCASCEENPEFPGLILPHVVFYE